MCLIIPAHDPEGATRYSQASNSSDQLGRQRDRALAVTRVIAGLAATGLSCGMVTSAPPASSSLIAAKPIDGRIMSTRQVTKNPTRMVIGERASQYERVRATTHIPINCWGKMPKNNSESAIEREQYPHVAARLEWCPCPRARQNTSA